MSHFQLRELTTAQLAAIVRLINRSDDDGAQWQELREARDAIERVLVIRRAAADRLMEAVKRGAAK